MEDIAISTFTYLQKRGEDLKTKWNQYFLLYSGHEQPRDASTRTFSSVPMSQIRSDYLYWHGECCGFLQGTSTHFRELFQHGDNEIDEYFSNPFLNRHRFILLIQNKLEILKTHAEQGENSRSKIRRLVRVLTRSQEPLLKIRGIHLTANEIIAIIAFLSLIFNILQALVWRN